MEYWNRVTIKGKITKIIFKKNDFIVFNSKINNQSALTVTFKTEGLNQLKVGLNVIIDGYLRQSKYKTMTGLEIVADSVEELGDGLISDKQFNRIKKLISMEN